MPVTIKRCWPYGILTFNCVIQNKSTISDETKKRSSQGDEGAVPTSMLVVVATQVIGLGGVTRMPLNRFFLCPTVAQVASENHYAIQIAFNAISQMVYGKRVDGFDFPLPSGKILWSN